MAEQDEKKRLEVLKKEFDNDTAIVAEQASHFVTTMQPAYMVSEAIVSDLSYNNSAELLDAVSFYRIKSCSAENPDEIEQYLNTKMVKFYTAIHALNKPVVYGIVSYAGTTNLVIGVYSEDNNAAETVKSIMQGLLDGIELLPFKPDFTKRNTTSANAGFISGIPSVKIDDEKQFFDIGPIMKSLNGQNFSLLIVSRPVSEDTVSQKYGKMIRIRDACFAVSKRNLSRQHGTSHSVGETEGTSESHSHSKVAALNEYLEKWYEAHSDYAWYNSHLRDTDTYCGYWSFESAAVTRILKLDDSKLNDTKYYPVLE